MSEASVEEVAKQALALAEQYGPTAAKVTKAALSGDWTGAAGTVLSMAGPYGAAAAGILSTLTGLTTPDMNKVRIRPDVQMTLSRPDLSFIPFVRLAYWGPGVYQQENTSHFTERPPSSDWTSPGGKAQELFKLWQKFQLTAARQFTDGVILPPFTRAELSHMKAILERDLPVWEAVATNGQAGLATGDHYTAGVLDDAYAVADFMGEDYVKWLAGWNYDPPLPSHSAALADGYVFYGDVPPGTEANLVDLRTSALIAAQLTHAVIADILAHKPVSRPIFSSIGRVQSIQVQQPHKSVGHPIVGAGAGAALGFAVAGPPGAIAGAILGFLFGS